MNLRNQLSAKLQVELLPFHEQSDECWAAFGREYKVSNYGLVVNVSKHHVVAWRHHDKMLLVSIGRSTLSVASVVYAAFFNDGALLSRQWQITFVDGDSANVKTTNLVASKRTYTRKADLLNTIDDYNNLLRMRGDQ